MSPIVLEMLNSTTNADTLKEVIESSLIDDFEKKSYYGVLQDFVRTTNQQMISKYPEFRGRNLIEEGYSQGPLYVHEGHIKIFAFNVQNILFYTDSSQSTEYNARKFLEEKENLLHTIDFCLKEEVQKLKEFTAHFQKAFSEVLNENFKDILETSIMINGEYRPLAIRPELYIKRYYLKNDDYTVKMIVEDQSHNLTHQLDREGLNKFNLHWSYDRFINMMGMPELKELLRKEINTILNNWLSSVATNLRKSITNKKFANLITVVPNLTEKPFELDYFNRIKVGLNVSKSDLEKIQRIYNLKVKINSLNVRMSRIVNSFKMVEKVDNTKGFSLEDKTIQYDLDSDQFYALLEEISEEIRKVTIFEYMHTLKETPECKLNTEIFYKETNRFTFNGNEYVVFHYKGVHDRQKQKRVYENGKSIPINRFYKILRKYNKEKATV